MELFILFFVLADLFASMELTIYDGRNFILSWTLRGFVGGLFVVYIFEGYRWTFGG